jgi:FkbH-like protein
MKLEDVRELIKSRIALLYKLGSKSISVALQFPSSIVDFSGSSDYLRAEFPGVPILEINRKNLSSNFSFEDKRLQSISANWLTKDAYSYFGRQIAMNILLPFLVTRIKLIAIDLDNTMYNGVLAEDGINAIWQSDFQVKLTSWLFQQKSSGVMVAIISRNEEEDVEKLLKSHPEWAGLFDFVLASWKPKEKLIEEVLSITRISQESVIFIDDSIYELNNVQNSFPKIQKVQYRDDPETINLLTMHPGLNSTQIPVSSGIDRASDLKSNTKRESIFTIMSDKEAFKELRVELNFKKDSISHVTRGAELSSKTNQFNFALRRLTNLEIRSYVDNPHTAIVLADLKDKYADSGLISFMCLNLSGEEILVVEEFCISCRALGRGLEDEIFFGSLFTALQGQSSLNFKEIHIMYRQGERNSPVIEWTKTRNWVVKSNHVEIPYRILSTWRSQIS